MCFVSNINIANNNNFKNLQYNGDITIINTITTDWSISFFFACKASFGSDQKAMILPLPWKWMSKKPNKAPGIPHGHSNF